jgi:hypothetical protein
MRESLARPAAAAEPNCSDIEEQRLIWKVSDLWFPTAIPKGVTDDC